MKARGNSKKGRFYLFIVRGRFGCTLRNLDYYKLRFREVEFAELFIREHLSGQTMGRIRRIGYRLQDGDRILVIDERVLPPKFARKQFGYEEDFVGLFAEAGFEIYKDGESLAIMPLDLKPIERKFFFLCPSLDHGLVKKRGDRKLRVFDVGEAQRLLRNQLKAQNEGKSAPMDIDLDPGYRFLLLHEDEVDPGWAMRRYDKDPDAIKSKAVACFTVCVSGEKLYIRRIHTKQQDT